MPGTRTRFPPKLEKYVRIPKKICVPLLTRKTSAYTITPMDSHPPITLATGQPYDSVATTPDTLPSARARHTSGSTVAAELRPHPLCPPDIEELTDDQLRQLTRRQRYRDTLSLHREDPPGQGTSHFALQCRVCGRRTDDPAEIALGHNQLWFWVAVDICLPCSSPEDIHTETASILDIVDAIYRHDRRTARRRRRKRLLKTPKQEPL